MLRSYHPPLVQEGCCHSTIEEYNTTFEACSGIEIALSGYPVTEIMNFVPGGSSDMFDINGSLFTVIF